MTLPARGLLYIDHPSGSVPPMSLVTELDAVAGTAPA